MRTIVFGDAHGCLEPILRLMNKIGLKPGDHVISIGDFMDRGPDSPGCINYVMRRERMTGKPGSIMGNHEFKHVRGIMSPSQIAAKAQFDDADMSYDEAVAYMETLPFYLELPEAILVHAGLVYGIPMEEQDPLVLVGGTSQRHICGFNKRTGLMHWCPDYPRDAKPVIFGHLSCRGGIPVQGNLYPIDTGCVRGYAEGGMLTAVTLPDFKVYQVPGRRE